MTGHVSQLGGRRIALVALLALVLACATAAIAAAPAHAMHQGQKFTLAGNVYKITDYESDDDDLSEVMLVRYGSSARQVYIDTIAYRGERFEVETIAKNAFNNAKGHRVTTVTLGRNVERVGARAFFGCKKLRVLNIRNNDDLVELERSYRGWHIDEVNIGSQAFKKAGVKKVQVQSGYRNDACRRLVKKALVSKGMKKSVRIVY